MHRNNILNQTVPVVGAQGATAASDISPAESKCNYCEMTFPTLMGQQQHARHKHPVEYNAECLAKVKPSRKWTFEECYLLAVKEVELSRGGTQPITIQQLVEFSGTHRSKDAITKARSTPEYLEILRELTTPPEGSDSNKSTELPTVNPS